MPSLGSVRAASIMTMAATMALRNKLTEIMNLLRYSVVIKPLTGEDEGGFTALVPDPPECMSDGETLKIRSEMFRMQFWPRSRRPRIWAALSPNYQGIFPRRIEK